MSYLEPTEFVTKMVDQGESKVYMSTKDTLIRAFMAGAILGLAAVFAITVATKTGSPLVGAILFPVGFIMLYLMKFDLLTGVFTLVPLVELFLLIRIGEIIGIWATVGLVIFTGVLGAFLTRLEGMRVLRQVREELAEGRVPTEKLLDGLLVLLAGAVLLTPGLITDLVGFLLLIPAGRRFVRTLVSEAVSRRLSGSRQTVIDADWRRHDGG